jgi:hypothetical protein
MVRRVQLEERSALDRCFSDRDPLYDPQTKQMLDCLLHACCT